MRNIEIEEIKSEREIGVLLVRLDRQIDAALKIKDARKRCKEIVRIQSDVKFLIATYKRKSRSTNFSDKEKNLYDKVLGYIKSWFVKNKKKF